MSQTMYLTRDALAGLVDAAIASGTRVIAPAPAADGGTDYRPIARFDEAELDGPMPRRSLRSVFQPATEPVFTWRREEGRIRLEPSTAAPGPQIVLGARPCDAAGAGILDRVMDWDYRDDLWFARREATTVISVACAQPRKECFCGAVGLGPESPDGSDILLHAEGNGYRVDAVTPKGEAFTSANAKWFSEAPPSEPAPRAGTGEPLPLEAIRTWLEGHFQDDLWTGVALRCLGCGACTSICPTCHCFDLVDETDGTSTGTRRRNWDTCQAGLFTLHTSGHNPRPDQTARCRQRVMHKFLVYPQRFGRVLCTGCGRCVGACPAGIALPEVLQTIAERAAQPGEPA